ncbi:MAG TPA: DUF2000 family protein [Dyella sp.]|uniref:DUF2000 family protein n=1 Tax=Dyella sp. TaxID=1869338 RepID=UPI002F95D4EB
MFDTKVALVVRNDLPTWQKLNVTAFLATGIAAAAPEAIGKPYMDASGTRYGSMLVQPIVVFGADVEELRHARQKAIERSMLVIPYVEAMFRTGNDEANRQAFLVEAVDSMNLVGIGIRGPKNGVDKVLKGFELHA